MTTLGFHYFPDDMHFRLADLNTWLPELLSMDARWLTLTGSLTRAVPEAFVKGLLDAGIEPIIHLPSVPLQRDALSVTTASLAMLFRTYARWGARYVVPFSEPNARAAWAPADWGQTSLVHRFLDLLIPLLEAQREAGLEATFPALKAGGDYWDTAFLEAALAGMASRGLIELARSMTFATNLWTYNRPISWGAGGHKRWPNARPYLTPPGSQDQRGFQRVDWYSAIVEEQLGTARPFLCLAGGPCPGDHTDPNFPAATELWHASCTQGIVDAIQNAQLPANLMNVNFWLLSAPDSSPFSNEAWYRPGGSTLAAVATLKKLGGQGQHAQRRQMNESKGLERPASAQRPTKPIKHYLLLPTFEWGVSEWHWNAALEFVKAHQPACGFSAAEAAQAERVTLLSSEQGISAEVEARLRRAGCAVERIAPAGDRRVTN